MAILEKVGEFVLLILPVTLVIFFHYRKFWKMSSWGEPRQLPSAEEKGQVGTWRVLGAVCLSLVLSLLLSTLPSSATEGTLPLVFH